MAIYILKASAILALFLAFYQVFLKNETFFKLNRFFLLTGLAAALLLPFVTIRQEVLIPVSMVNGSTEPITINGMQDTGLPWETILRYAYLGGMGYFLIRMLSEIRRLLQMIRNKKTTRKDGFILVPGSFARAPFSFFRYIFFDPETHDGEELQQILEHEMAHGRQLHSVDILLGRIVAILLWANPMAWWYQKNIHQNLEYLADAQAVRKLPSIRQYQYTLLKVSGNPIAPGLVNAFYSSLIKKRIVMLQQNQSKTIHLLKYLLMLPVLALFLMAFSRETVYVPEGPTPQELFVEGKKIIEVIIDKNTSDDELLKMKEKFLKDEIDFSYTVVRNDAGEIIDINFDISGKADNGNPFSGSYAADSDNPIKPIMIQITSTGGVYFGQVDAHGELHKGNTFHYNTSGSAKIWVQKDGDSDSEMIEIRKVNGKEVIIVDGKEITREELHEVGDSKKIFVQMVDGDEDAEVHVKKYVVDKDGKHEQVIILGPDSDGNYTGSHSMKVHVDGDENSGERTVIIKSAGDGNTAFDFSDGDPLFVIDGKKASRKDAMALDSSEIETINVWKGDKAVEKYGKKAKDGVVEITTKKQ